MKILWIYCIIVRSFSIDFRKREKRCTSISLEWTGRTLPIGTDSRGGFKTRTFALMFRWLMRLSQSECSTQPPQGMFAHMKPFVIITDLRVPLLRHPKHHMARSHTAMNYDPDVDQWIQSYT